MEITHDREILKKSVLLRFLSTSKRLNFKNRTNLRSPEPWRESVFWRITNQLRQRGVSWAHEKSALFEAQLPTRLRGECMT